MDNFSNVDLQRPDLQPVGFHMYSGNIHLRSRNLFCYDNMSVLLTENIHWLLCRTPSNGREAIATHFAKGIKSTTKINKYGENKI